MLQNKKNKKNKEGGMVGAVLGPAVCQVGPAVRFPPLLATTEEGGENVSIGMAAAARETCDSHCEAMWR